MKKEKLIKLQKELEEMIMPLEEGTELHIELTFVLGKVKMKIENIEYGITKS